MIISVITWIVFGALAGWLISLIARPANSQDTLEDINVGIIGALIGGFLSRAITNTGLSQFDWRSLVIASFCAATLVLIVRGLRRPKFTPQ